jgi:hypothetical protein
MRPPTRICDAVTEKFKDISVLSDKEQGAILDLGMLGVGLRSLCHRSYVIMN